MTESSILRVALSQFFVQETSEENSRLIDERIARAAGEGAGLLILPEGVLARRPGCGSWGAQHAERIDGPFVTRLLESTAKPGRENLLVVCTALLKKNPGDPAEKRAANMLLAVRNGRLELAYQKLHLYDAFKAKESDNVVPGDEVPKLLKAGPFTVGFLTCYDLRFPELARRLAVDGAELLAAPSAWVKGPLKEMHWDLCIRGRALENTCYVAGVSECGPVNIGESKIADPLGFVCAQCGPSDEMRFADLDRERVLEARRSLPVLENRRFRTPELR